MNDKLADKIKDTIQDCNLNFLLGSGLSAPYLRTLGNIETLLTDLDQTTLTDPQKASLKCSLYRLYFDEVIAKNLFILASAAESAPVLTGYCDFLSIVNSILLRRKSTILSKEANLFTTNIDIFLDKALEDLGLEYNDGFNGRFTPAFSLSNFKTSRFKKSLHYDNVSEMPVFNLLKLHGSLTWKMTADAKIVFSSDLQQIATISGLTVTEGSTLAISEDSTIAGITAAAAGLATDESVYAFLKAYEELLIVNPTKEKFRHSLLNQTYYEMLRLYNNELEKENTVLFAMGCSFADEHIRDITLRAAKSNRTLMTYVFAHTSSSRQAIQSRFGTHGVKNSNIEVIGPLRGEQGDAFVYDLATINRTIFGTLFGDDRSAEDVAAAGEPEA